MFTQLTELHKYIHFTAIFIHFLDWIILQVHAVPRYKTTIFSADFKTISFHPVLTEMGICFTFSGIITDYLIPK